MKRNVTILFFSIACLMSTQVLGQTFGSFYNSLTELSIPYAFSDDTHYSTPEVDLISSIKDQDQLLLNYKAVARVNLGDGYSFVIVKRIFEEDLDNLFLLLTIDGSEQIVGNLAIDVKADDGQGVDFKITEEKILRVARYDGTNAEIVDYTFTNGQFETDGNVEAVSQSSLSSM